MTWKVLCGLGIGAAVLAIGWSWVQQVGQVGSEPWQIPTWSPEGLEIMANTAKYTVWLFLTFIGTVLTASCAAILLYIRKIGS